MKNRLVIVPFLMFVLAHAQQAGLSRIEYGFAASTFSGLGLQSFFLSPPDVRNPSALPPVRVPHLNYGWQEGFFLWLNVSDGIVVKPQLDVGAFVSDYGAFTARGGSHG
ncbi:MAG: hypothetical protein ACXVPQ_01720, partial [Bacteroidia bacterium]